MWPQSYYRRRQRVYLQEMRSPHIFTRKSRVQPKEILITSAKRLLQQYLPAADSCSAAINRLFDHLVSRDEQTGRRHGQAECLRGFKVEERFEPGRRLHRKVPGFVVTQYAIDIRRCLPKFIDVINPIGHETTGCDQRTVPLSKAQATPPHGLPNRQAECHDTYTLRDSVGWGGKRAFRDERINYRTMNGPAPRSSQLIYLISFGASRIVSTNYRPRSKTSGTALFRPKHGSNGSKERSSKNLSLQGRHQINDPRRDDRWRILAGPGATGCTQFHTASNCLSRQRT